MLKSILKVEGAKVLSKSDQQSVQGGWPPLKPSRCCDPADQCCIPIPIPVSCNGTAASGCQFAFPVGGNHCCI